MLHQSGLPEPVSYAAAANYPAPPGPGEKAILRREDRHWTIDLGGKLLCLKHTKGMACIAYLLGHPGREVHCLQLCERMEDSAGDPGGWLGLNREELEASGIHIGGLGDAGEMLDEQAKAAYRARLAELREQLDDAREVGNTERAARAEDEIETLKAELARAVGLRGRSRRAASAAERARQRVKKAIQTALEGIGKLDQRLCQTLSRCIRTGTYCCYLPDCESAIDWQGGGGGASSIRSPAYPDSGARIAAIPDSSRPLIGCPERQSFAGRVTELGHLRALIDGGQQGRGAVALICGGPGVGKSRLVLEAANYASARGFGVLTGHCYESEAALEYLAFAEIIESGLCEGPIAEELRCALADNAEELAPITPCLRRLYPGRRPAPNIPPQQSRRDLFQALCDALARVALKLPLVLVLEDLQWAHESTLALLVHLAYRVPHLPIVVIATYRNTDMRMDSALARTLDELHRGGVNPLRLRGLSQSEVEILLRGLSHHELPPRFVKLVFDATNGNPFFVEELYQYLLEGKRIFDSSGNFRTDFELRESDVPESVRLVVGRRLERLGVTGKRVLTAAAVLGRSFSFKLLQTVLGEVDLDDLLTSLEHAQRMDLLVPGCEGPETPLEFSHEIVRRTLLADISPPRRHLIHLRLADAAKKLAHSQWPRVEAAVLDAGPVHEIAMPASAWMSNLLYPE
jgi:hypothetical protein